MMVAAVAAGVLFYLGLIVFHDRSALLALQLFNAILSVLSPGLACCGSGFDAGAGRSGHDAVYQQYFHRGDSRRRAAGSVVAKLRPRQRVLGHCRHLAADAVLTSKVKDI